MCGIVGLVGRLVVGSGESTALLETAANSMAYRGPDATGAWVSSRSPVGFGHRRLAVIDLDESANQPMGLDDGNGSRITFNGEIYNYREIRADLAARGLKFRTNSDTEVLLRLCDVEGVEPALRRLRGMFAFAFFSAKDNTVWLARDRFGEKPLYYAIGDGTLGFASDLHGIRAFRAFSDEIDPVSVDALMRRSCIGGSQSVYTGVHKVLPGTALRVDVGDVVSDRNVRKITYWDPVGAAAHAAERPFRGNIDAAADKLDDMLGESVVAASVSDVPLGAFLSAGIDSTSVVSQLVRRSNSTVKTFTIGFTTEYRSEADEARRIADHLGTHHTDLTITSAELQAVIPHIADIFDEPFADSSQIPTYLVSKLARSEVTVALTGDGGDEMFCGYPRFTRAGSVLATSQRVPRQLRAMAANRLDGVQKKSWRRLSTAMVGPLRRHSGGLNERSDKAVAMLAAEDLDAIYPLFVTSFWNQEIVPGVRRAADALPLAASPVHQMMLHDILTYLPDDILTKVDRAAMAVSLETRVPLLTPEIFDLSHRLPVDYLVKGREQKRVLKHLLARHVPIELWDQPKRGFSIPIGSWLRGPLREWAGDLLSPGALAAHGLLDASIVDEIWTEHCGGRRDRGSQLWNVLMFQAWYARHHGHH